MIFQFDPLANKVVTDFSRAKLTFSTFEERTNSLISAIDNISLKSPRNSVIPFLLFPAAIKILLDFVDTKRKLLLKIVSAQMNQHVVLSLFLVLPAYVLNLNWNELALVRLG